MSETAKAIQLFHEDGKPSGIWYCSECRAVHNQERLAQSCHGVTHCEDCAAELGKRQPYYRTHCQDCDNKRWREKQAKIDKKTWEELMPVTSSD